MKRHNDQPISEILKTWKQTSKFKPMLIQQKIEAEWENWFGKIIDKNTEKLLVKENKLYIYLKSAPLKYELHLGRIKIMGIINEKLGENYFEEIIIH